MQSYQELAKKLATITALITAASSASAKTSESADLQDGDICRATLASDIISSLSEAREIIVPTGFRDSFRNSWGKGRYVPNTK